MSKTGMTIKETIRYLQPIADSASLPRYADALNKAINAMKELEFTRNFIHEQGLTFALLNKWDEQKDHIADGGKKVHGLLRRVYEDSMGWVDICGNCKEVVDDPKNFCPHCGLDIRGEKYGKPI